MGVQICPSCGKKLAKDMKFCPYCGLILNFKNCPACGTDIEKNAKYCYHCGLDVGKGLVCSKCGTKISDVGQYCPKCGTRFEIHIPKNVEVKKRTVSGRATKCLFCGEMVDENDKYCFSCGNSLGQLTNTAYNHMRWGAPKYVIRLSATRHLSLSEGIMNFFEFAVFSGFRDRKIERELKEKYRKIFPDFPTFLEKAGKLFTNIIFNEVSDACDVLRIKYNIDSVTVNNFYNQSEGYSMSLTWAELIGVMGDSLQKSMDAAGAKNEYRKIKTQLNNSPFVGGGFGLGGAVKGMVTAGVLNTVWDGMRSVYDGVQYSRDRSRNIREGYEYITSEDYMSQLIGSVVYNLNIIGPIMAEIVYKQKGVFTFDPYYQDILSIKNDRKALELAKQAMKQNNLEVAKDMIIESLELNPYPSHAGQVRPDEDLREKYYILFELFGNDKGQITSFIKTVSPDEEAKEILTYIISTYVNKAKCSYHYDELKKAQQVVTSFIDNMDLPEDEHKILLQKYVTVLQRKYL